MSIAVWLSSWYLQPAVGHDASNGAKKVAERKLRDHRDNSERNDRLQSDSC